MEGINLFLENINLVSDVSVIAILVLAVFYFEKQHRKCIDDKKKYQEQVSLMMTDVNKMIERTTHILDTVEQRITRSNEQIKENHAEMISKINKISTTVTKLGVKNG